MTKEEYEKIKEEYFKQLEVLRYDILKYEFYITQDEYFSLEVNGSKLFEKYCDDICDCVVHTSDNYDSAIDWFKSFHSVAECHASDWCFWDDEEKPLMTVYVLCKVTNNDECEVLEYSKDK